jgi:hypothetical protein
VEINHIEHFKSSVYFVVCDWVLCDTYLLESVEEVVIGVFREQRRNIIDKIGVKSVVVDVKAL